MTTPYMISQCTVADGTAITRNNMAAFWEDPHYRMGWPHRTLDYHIAQKAKQMPRDLLDDDRTTKRHQKAIETETMSLVGYARWKIPASHARKPDGSMAWEEAVIPLVESEEEAEIRKIASSAVWDPNNDADELEVPVQML